MSIASPPSSTRKHNNGSERPCIDRLPMERIEHAMTESDVPKRKRLKKGEQVWADPIPDTFENVVKVVVTSPRREESEWDYLKRYRAPDRR